MKATIRAAFEKKLTDWAATKTPKIPIAYENVHFDPPANAVYLRCFLLPADTTDNTIKGDLTEYRGLFQVTIVYPAGVGPTSAESLASEIAALYTAKSRLAYGGKTVMVATPMRERPALQDAGTYTIPMDCRYAATS